MITDIYTSYSLYLLKLLVNFVLSNQYPTK